MWLVLGNPPYVGSAVPGFYPLTSRGSSKDLVFFVGVSLSWTEGGQCQASFEREDTLPPMNMELDVSGVLVWNIFLLKGSLCQVPCAKGGRGRWNKKPLQFLEATRLMAFSLVFQRPQASQVGVHVQPCWFPAGNEGMSPSHPLRLRESLGSKPSGVQLLFARFNPTSRFLRKRCFSS